MHDTNSSVPASLARRTPRLAALPLALTAAGALLFATGADARITRIEITAERVADLRRLLVARRRPVREDRRQGATARSNPHDPKNAVIVDIGLAPRNARGNVEYSFDFYILKPIDLQQGRAQGDVRAAEPRRQDLERVRPRRRRRQRPRLDHRSRGAGELVPHAARLHDRVERLGQVAPAPSNANFNTTITLPIAKNPDGSSITGPSYEYIVTGGASFDAELSGGDARQDARPS